jgi:diguanylate cyclase (GGDEF)-like protein
MAAVSLLISTPIQTFNGKSRISLYYLFSYFPLILLCILFIFAHRFLQYPQSWIIPLSFTVAVISSWSIYYGVLWRIGEDSHVYQNKWFWGNLALWLVIISISEVIYRGDAYTAHLITSGIGSMNLMILYYKSIRKIRMASGQNPGEKILTTSLIVKFILVVITFFIFAITGDHNLHLTTVALITNINVVLQIGSIYSMFLFDNINMHKEEASTDFLTGIYNRRAFMSKVDEIVDAGVNKHKPGVIVVCDIDNFKVINDTYGHDAGDIVIQTMATTFKNMLRRDDVCARMGGEEFALYLSDTNETYAITAIERIRLHLQNLTVNAQGMDINFTASFGYASISEDNSLGRTLRNADKAMYVAKDTGRNKACLYKG